MQCKFIHDSMLQQLADHHGLKLSTELRKQRSGFKKILSNHFGNKVESSYKRERVTYSCNNTTNLPGNLVLTELSPLTSADLIANCGHKNAADVYAFYASVFNRQSLDGNGMVIKSSVHYDHNYNNAFWNGTEMVYGDGDGQFFVELVKGKDVCAHEMSHAVTQYMCNLWYIGQSGAYNESFSDIMGIACKHWLNKEFEPEKANWLMGDSIIGPKFPGKAIRSFKDEKAWEHDNQPKNMKDYKWELSDSFGVHTNSGIPNHYFYLLCTNMNKPSYDKPAQIVYNAHKKLKPWAQFKDIAKAHYQTALEMYGTIDAQLVKESWSQVGI